MFCFLSFQVSAAATFYGFGKSWVSDVCVGTYRSEQAVAACLNGSDSSGYTFIASASRGWVNVDFYQEGKWRVHSENYVVANDNLPCPYGEDEGGKCKDKPPEENYCQSSEAISEMKRMRDECMAKGDPKTQNIDSSQDCDNDSRHITNTCRINDKPSTGGGSGSGGGKRLVPGFEAPVMLAYSARNRSASIRIPYVTNPKAYRIETRFPDPSANPYLCFAALMMAGLDGIQNKIHPGDPADKDLYDLPAEEALAIPTVAASLEEALDALDNDREFLTAGGVFTDDMIDAYIELKKEECLKVSQTTHPVEFDLYYSV